MSVQLMGKVLDDSRSEGNARLVLLALANHANDSVEGAHARVSWPSQATIAREANINGCSTDASRVENGVRTVRNNLATLEALGEIVMVPSDQVRAEFARMIRKQGRSNLYVLTVGLDAAEAAAIVRLVRGKAETVSASRKGETEAIEEETGIPPGGKRVSASGGNGFPPNHKRTGTEPEDLKGCTSLEDPERESTKLTGALCRFPAPPQTGGRRNDDAPRWIYGRVINVAGQLRLQWKDRSTGQRVHPDRCPPLYTLRGLEFVAAADAPAEAGAAGAAT